MDRVQLILGGSVWLLLVSSFAAPGDLDSSCSKTNIYRGIDLVMDVDGTLWAGGNGEVVHLSTEGEELHRFPHHGWWSRLVAHPMGGVVFPLPSPDSRAIADLGALRVESGEVVWLNSKGNRVSTFEAPPYKSCKLYSAGGKLWMAYDRRLVALDATGTVIPGLSYDYHNISLVVQGADESSTVVMRRTERGENLTLTTLSGEGAILSEVRAERAAHYDDALVCLGDGCFLVAGRSGVARLLPSGKLDSTYRYTGNGFRQGVTLAKRPDGRIMMLSGNQRYIDDLEDLDEVRGAFSLARLTPNGDLDESFPVSAFKGYPRGLVATDAWTYTLLNWFTRIDRLHRVESGDSEHQQSAPTVISDAAGGRVLSGLPLKEIGNASLCAMDRGDGFDDLILASGRPSDGLRRLVNSKNAETEWNEVLVPGGGNEMALRRIDSGDLNGDSMVDVIEWRRPKSMSAGWSIHWYTGCAEQGLRSLTYSGPLQVADLADAPSLDVRLADVDGDGDEDALVRYHSWPFGMAGGEDRPRPPQLSWWRNDGLTTGWSESVIGVLEDVYSTSVISNGWKGTPPTDMHVEDLDKDGDPDVAIVSVETGGMRVWFENQGGAFQRHGLSEEERRGRVWIPDMKGAPPVSSAKRPGLPLLSEWGGRVIGWANVNGDPKLDPILAIPWFEAGDTYRVRGSMRRLSWERGD